MIQIKPRPGVGKEIPIPASERMSPNPNPKNFLIQSQSQSFQNSILIPIPKFEPSPTEYREILGITIPKISLWKTSEILKKSIPNWDYPEILNNRSQSHGIGIPVPTSGYNFFMICLIIKVVKRKNNYF